MCWCVCVCVFTLWHKDTESTQLGKTSVTVCVDRNSWGSYCTCVSLLRALSHTCWAADADAAERPLQPRTVDLFLFSFVFLRCISALNRTELKQRLIRSPSPADGGCVDLAETVTESNFHGDAFEKRCEGLIDYEDHWIQQISSGLCHRLSGEGLCGKWTQTFVPYVRSSCCSSLRTFTVPGALGGGGDLLKDRSG